MDWAAKLKSARDLDQTLSAVDRFKKAVERLAGTPRGERNQELTKVAFLAGVMIESDQIQEHWAKGQLLEACRENEYVKDASEEEVMRIVNLQVNEGRQAEPADNPDEVNPLFKMVIPVSKIASLPQSEWMIKGLMYKDSTVFLIADPNVGKSFMALDIAAHLGTERSWHGREIKENVKTIYITPEGTGNLHKRVAAWEELNGKTMDNIEFFPFGIKVGSRQWDLLIDYAVKTKPGLIVIDTWSRNNGGRDENGQADTSLAIEQLDKLRNATGATLLILHHLNKMGQIRGSTTLEGAADTIINLADPGHGILNCWTTKQKDGDKGHVGQFRLEEVVLDATTDATSVVFTPVNPIPWEGKNNDD